MKRIRQYLEDFAQLCKVPFDESHLLLGRKPQKIIHFLTRKSFSLNLKKNLQKIKEQLKRKDCTLVINGNLEDRDILRLATLAEKMKRKYTIVVMDGYRSFLNKTKLTENHLAAIIEED